ncbi:hypothetical protein AVEN_211676-1, partial [Araneus ventricosus]
LRLQLPMQISFLFWLCPGVALEHPFDCLESEWLRSARRVDWFLYINGLGIPIVTAEDGW